MSEGISLRLDMLRALAALSVFLTHFIQLGVDGVSREAVAPLGRLGVVAFFVLSGYVIAYVAEHKHTDWRGYLHARLARLLSVYIPALGLTIALDLPGRWLQPGLYAGQPPIELPRLLAYLPVFLSFLFENALFSLRWFSNSPLWSIAYEFWYYVLFGIVFYLRGPARAILLPAALVLAGWKVLLLAPIWAAGALLYRFQAPIARRLQRHRIFIVAGSLLAIAWVLSPIGQETLAPLRLWGQQHLPPGFHALFLSDFASALPVLALTAALVSAGEATPAWPRIRPWAAWLAGFSFSIYLYHVPLILVIRAARLYPPDSLPGCVAAAALVLLCCHRLATVTEHRKMAWLMWVQRASLGLDTRRNRNRPHA